MATDIFKLLSRSSKLRRGTRPEPTQQYPSCGEKAKVQILGRRHGDGSSPSEFGRGDGLSQTPQQPTRKRKRGQTTPGHAEALPQEIDFFSNGTVPASSSNHKDVPSSPVQTINDEASPPSPLDPRVHTMSEDQCKRMLRDHRIKITVLEDWTTLHASISTSRSGRKSGRGSQDTESPGGKNKHKTQVYPSPLTSFRELSPGYRISKRLLDNVLSQGYHTPTEVQMAAIPLLLDRTTSSPPHLLNIAPTGSGKTLAFLIPAMDSVMQVKNELINTSDTSGPHPSGKVDHSPLVMILAPTKELASQIVNEGRKLSMNTGIKITQVKKNMVVPDAFVPPSSIQEDSRPLVKAHILVSTPMSFLHSITRPNGSITNLPSTRHIILDEADVLLAPLFRDQVLSVWHACTHPNLHITMWSATMGSNIEVLARETIASKYHALADSTALLSQPPLLRLVVGLKDTALPSITHRLIYAATEAGKLMAIRQLLHPAAASPTSSRQPLLGSNDVSSLRPPFLVFTQTIPRAKALAAELQYDIPASAGGRGRIAALHADLSDTSRDLIMTEFRMGEIWVLITTDLLARGVDFRGINGVVNYDVPTSAASYIHRAGRTGRAGRAGGMALTLYAEEDVPFIKPIANVIASSQKVSGADHPDGSLQSWLLDALPNPTKRERKMLKKRGVETRRPGNEKGKISTKSGYERKMDHRRREAREARTKQARAVDVTNDADMNNVFEGFED